MSQAASPTPSGRQPSLFIPHGGGPCFFMPDPSGMWTRLADYLRSLPATLPQRPTALIVVTAHWETDGFAFTGGSAPGLIYDYHGFPPETYAIAWPAPGAPALAAKAARLLGEAGLRARVDPTHGFDHGVFVPMKVMYPDADIPTVAMSLDSGLDPELHRRAGEALASLRDEGVLIIGSGSSFHNMGAMRDPRIAALSGAFDGWLRQAATTDAADRAATLNDWASAPNARGAHPREEHLLPLMVAAGASDHPGTLDYAEDMRGVLLSAFRFD